MSPTGESISEPDVFPFRESLGKFDISPPRKFSNISPPQRKNFGKPALSPSRKSIGESDMSSTRESFGKPDKSPSRKSIGEPDVFSLRKSFDKPDIFQPKESGGQPNVSPPIESIEIPNVSLSSESIGNPKVSPSKESIENLGSIKYDALETGSDRSPDPVTQVKSNSFSDSTRLPPSITPCPPSPSMTQSCSTTPPPTSRCTLRSPSGNIPCSSSPSRSPCSGISSSTRTSIEDTKPGGDVIFKTESNSPGILSQQPRQYSEDLLVSRRKEKGMMQLSTGGNKTWWPYQAPRQSHAPYEEDRLKDAMNLETMLRISGEDAAAAKAERENQHAAMRRIDRARQANQGGDTENQHAALRGMEITHQHRQANHGADPFIGGHFPIPVGPPPIPYFSEFNVPEAKLKCPFCERTYGYDTNLRAHVRQCHQGIRVPCPFCHRSFTRNSTVRRHIAREHQHQIHPNLIPAKFGATAGLPDAPFQDHLTQSNRTFALACKYFYQP